MWSKDTEIRTVTVGVVKYVILSQFIIRADHETQLIVSLTGYQNLVQLHKFDFVEKFASIMK